MKRIVLQILAGFGLALLLVVAVDYALWTYHVSRGIGFESVKVSRVQIATLKGSKEEYYSDGYENVQCTRSMLPMPAADGWFAPCWWQVKHRSVEVRY